MAERVSAVVMLLARAERGSDAPVPTTLPGRAPVCACRCVDDGVVAPVVDGVGVVPFDVLEDDVEEVVGFGIGLCEAC